MLPFYFLSVTINLIMGIILVFLDKRDANFQDTNDYSKFSFLHDQTFLLVFIIFAGITAIFKVLSPIGDSIPVIGDLLPAVASGLGFMVFLVRYLRIAQPSVTIPLFLEKISSYEYYIGFITLFAGVAHLLFPQAVLL